MTLLVRTITGKVLEVAKEIAAMGFKPIVPMQVVRVRKRGARRYTEERCPILDGYLFCDARSYYPPICGYGPPGGGVERIREIDDVIGYFHMTQQDVADLDRFVRRAAAGYFDHDQPGGSLRPGQVMRLIGGMFEGLLFSFERVQKERMIGTLPSGARIEVGLDDAEVA